MHERKLRLIVIHDGDLETKTIEISYRRLKLLGSLLAVLMVVFIVMASMWFYIATQATRVRGLEEEVKRLDEERAKVAELAQTLVEVVESRSCRPSGRSPGNRRRESRSQRRRAPGLSRSLASSPVN